MRSPDGSADIYQLLAGLAVACRHGFEIEKALEIADKTYVNVNIHDSQNSEKLKSLSQLPANCAESADMLQKQRDIYQKYDVFSPRMIDGIIQKLRDYNDIELLKHANNNPKIMQELVTRYFHCG